MAQGSQDPFLHRYQADIFWPVLCSYVCIIIIPCEKRLYVKKLHRAIVRQSAFSCDNIVLSAT